MTGAEWLASNIIINDGVIGIEGDTGKIKVGNGRSTWNGSAWVLKYTPYTYPHPLRNGETPSPSRNARVGTINFR